MPRHQTSVKLSANERGWLTRYGEPLSSQLREDAQVLAGLVDLGRREIILTEGETNLLRDLCNGSVFPVEIGPRGWPLSLALKIEDAEPAYAERWGVDAPALAARLKALSPLGALAIWHDVRAWWARQGGDGA